MPPEYCEFGPDFEKCKPWLIQNVPDLYPDLLNGIYHAEFPNLFSFYFDPSCLILNFECDLFIYFYFCAEANEKEADKVADKLQGTSITSGSSDGAASSGQFFL